MFTGNSIGFNLKSLFINNYGFDQVPDKYISKEPHLLPP